MSFFQPKLLTTLRGYHREQFIADASAGIVVGIVALPLAIAFGIASGVSPERGLYTAIIGGLLISLLGGSRVQIGGPTGAFIVIVAGIVQEHGYAGLQVATLMAGAILVFMGLARFGGAIKFIPYPVVVGFTSGIALIIGSSQVKDLLGLPLVEVPVDFMRQWAAYGPHLSSFNPAAAAVSIGSLAVILLWRKVSRRVPGFLVALVAATAVAQIFNLPVETVGSRFGEIPHLLPRPTWPALNLHLIRDLIPSAMTIALLAGIEGLLSAVVADGMIGGRHRSNTELIAQGIANIFTPLFGGLPATGAIARTATNVHCGGRTPVAGIMHAVTLLLILLFCGRWAGRIPLPCLGAILVVVAYNMSEWRAFRSVLRSPRSDVVVLLTTFGLTVLANLTIAIQVGMVLAAFLFMRRMAQVTNVEVVTKEFLDEDEGEDPNAITTRQVPDGVEVYEINGPFFFGASHAFREAMRLVRPAPKVIILRMRRVFAIDATGLQMLREQQRDAQRQGTVLILSGVHAQPLIAIERSDLMQRIGEQHIFGNIDDALNDARMAVGLAPLARPVPFVPTVRRENASDLTSQH